MRWNQQPLSTSVNLCQPICWYGESRCIICRSKRRRRWTKESAFQTSWEKWRLYQDLNYELQILQLIEELWFITSSWKIPPGKVRKVLIPTSRLQAHPHLISTMCFSWSACRHLSFRSNPPPLPLCILPGEEQSSNTWLLKMFLCQSPKLHSPQSGVLLLIPIAPGSTQTKNSTHGY